jgi:RNA polymerase sigma-70 factor (ECF subfamily)
MPEPMRDRGPSDPGTVASVFAAYAEGLHSFLKRRVGSPEDAEDIFQTIFERLSRVKRPDLIQKPHEYLFGIAFHVVREFWIKSKRDADVVAIDSPAVEEADSSLAHAHADEIGDRLNLHQQLERALAQLPQAHRQVVLCCKRDGMTYEEASRATGISPDMVHKILIQAKAKLTALMWDI